MAKGKLEVSGESRCGREPVITDASNDRSVSIFRVKQSEKLEHLSVRPYVTSHALVPINLCSSHPIVTIYRLHHSNRPITTKTSVFIIHYKMNIKY